MRKTDFSEKKQYGDAARVAPIVNAKRKDAGKKPYSIRMINAMLAGQRNMPEYVRDVVDKYYEKQDKLTKDLME